MYAVIKHSGKQFRLSVGDVVDFDRIAQKEGETFDVTDVLLVADGDNVKIGTPLVEGAKVTLEVKKHFRGPKLIVFKMKRRKRYRNKQGHRQELTQCEVKAIA